MCALVCVAGLLQRALTVSAELGGRNQRTLAKISCREDGRPWTSVTEGTASPTCDDSPAQSDSTLEPADYVLDRHSRFFLFNKGPPPRIWLDRSDVAFLKRFRTPELVQFETGERWKIYSQPAEIDGRPVEVMVAAFEAAPWTMKNILSDDIDEQLKSEAQRIARQSKAGSRSSRADAWQVVDSTTGNVIDSNGDAPALYPGSVPGLRPWTFVLQDGQIWLARSAATEQLGAVSVASVTSLNSFGLLGLSAFVLGTLGAYPMTKKLVNPGIRRPAPLEEALRGGEGETVEFKQEIKDRHTLLKDITAFANTKGGTVFIGIADGTREVVGIDAATPERRDAFELRLRDSIRQSIQPPPEIVIDYSEKNARIVARILVLAGRNWYSYEGRYYVREGSLRIPLMMNGRAGGS